MRKQTFRVRFDAKPAVVYSALLDVTLLPLWRVPDGMTMIVHEFHPAAGGRFRISLSYDDISESGKTVTNTDTYGGYFRTLIPNKKIVEVISFETTNSDFMGEMIITTELCSDGEGTELIATHENLPEAVSAEQNEIGWKMSLGKLAKLI